MNSKPSFTILQFFVVFQLLLASNCLHLTKHLNLQTYVSILKNQHASIDQGLENLSTILDTIDSNLEGKTVDQKIQILQKAILQQQQELTNIQQSFHLPLEQTSFSCPASEGQNKEKIQSIIGLMETDSSELEATVENLTDNTKNQQVLKDIEIVNEALAQAKNTLALESSSSQVLYETNLLAQDWILGDQSVQELAQKLSEESSDKSVEYCPVETPFFDGDSCIICLEGQYFNLENRECVSCKKYNAETHRCDDTIGINLNVGADRVILPEETSLSNLTADKMCPEETPFYNDEDCINCEDPTPYFNYSIVQCSNCADNEEYSADSHSCEKKVVFVTNYDFNTALDRVIIDNQKTLAQLINEQDSLSQLYQVKECPKETPFYTGEECIPCNEGFLFSDIEKKCSDCPQNTFYNIENHHCEDYKYFSNLNNQQWFSDTKSYKQVVAQNQESSQALGAKQCKGDLPFWNQYQCISCPEKQQFNVDSKQCQPCPQGYYFSINLHKCLQISPYSEQTNPGQAPNLIYNGDSNAQWMANYYQNIVKNQNMADCPETDPYWDEYSCIMCPQEKPYYNLKYYICSTCSSGTTYDAQIHECMSEDYVIVDQKPNVQKFLAGIFS